MKKPSQIGLFATVLVIMAFSVCFAKEELSNLERLAISAVNAEMTWTKDVPTNVFPVGINFIEKHKIMGVRVNWGCPGSKFYVAIDDNEKAYVFTSYRYGGTGHFTEVMKKENREVNESNIRKYLKAFLLLVDKNATLIDTFHDIVFLSRYEENQLWLAGQSVKPVAFTVKDEGIEIVFCSWNYGKISKWELMIKKNGEVLSCNKKDLNSKSTRTIP